MASVRELLNHVWAAFRQVGIADDLMIIEYIAALLLPENAPSSESSDLWPRMPPAQRDFNANDIRQLLSVAVDEAGGAATLFDRHILFRVPSMLPGGRYPTPRHIVASMLRLAEVGSTHRLADFACGSGGLLVHRTASYDNKATQTVGIEISPEWARLARANAYLHGLTSPRIEIGNALQVCSPEGNLADETFDHILMNPSFGERIDTMLAEMTLGFRTGSRSETALAALAVHKLAPDGRAAILAPSGLLFSNSAGERELRERLVDTLELEAVLTFPREAFQPYSTLQTHLFLIRKKTPEVDSRTWFFQTERDGYPAGRGRDLTTLPTGASDLPFVEGVFATRDTAFSSTFEISEVPLIGVKIIVTENNQLLGVVIEAMDTTTLTAVDRFPSIGETPAFLLAESHKAEAQHICVQISLDNGEAHEVKDRDALINRLYKPRRQDPSPGTTLLRGEHPGQAVAISSDGRLVGATVPRTELRARAYDLRPERYVKAPEEIVTAESPASLLASLRRNQRQLLTHIDGLIGRLELAPIADQTLPSPLLGEDDKAVEPFGLLSRDQKAVWGRVRRKVQRARDAEPPYETAVLFTPEDVNPDRDAEVSNATRDTLELLERMGVIVPVTLTDPNTGESAAFYRRVTERDRWSFDSEAPGTEDEGL